MPRITPHLRPLWEVMFAAYSSVLIVLVGSTGVSNLDWWMQAPLRIVDAALLHACGIVFFRGGPPLRLFYGTWIIMAAVMLITVRVLSSIKAIRPILLRILGVIVFAGPLHTLNFKVSPPSAVPPEYWWQWAEVAAAVGFVIFFSSRRGLRLGAAVILVIVSVHFGFWFLLRWSGGTWYEWQWQMVALLILPFCTALTWCFSVRAQQGRVQQIPERPTPK